MEYGRGTGQRTRHLPNGPRAAFGLQQTQGRTAALGAKRKATAPMFVELLSALPSGSPECIIELEGPRGKMRIQWKGATAADLAGLSRVLWEPA